MLSGWPRGYVLKRVTSISSNQLKQAAKISDQEFTWGRLAWAGRVGLSFPVNSYYANFKKLRQTKAVLIVSTRLGRARTPLPGNLSHSTYAFTVIFITIIIVVILINIIINTIVIIIIIF